MAASAPTEQYVTLDTYLPAFLAHVRKTDTLKQELEFTQAQLKLLHSPLYKIQHPNDSKETIQEKIKTATCVFQALLGLKQVIEQEKGKAALVKRETGPHIQVPDAIEY
jgi:hypothetical protein